MQSSSRKAEREGDYGLVAELRYGKIKEKEIEIESLKMNCTSVKVRCNDKRRGGCKDTADVVARWTGIPVSK